MIRTLFYNCLALLVLLTRCCLPSLAFHPSEEKKQHPGVSDLVAVADDKNEVVWAPISHRSLDERVTSTHDGTSSSPRQRGLSPREGEVRLLVLLIRFPEHSARVLPAVADIQTLCDEQIAPYFYQQSYGKYIIVQCDVQDWVTADNSEEYYSGGVSGMTGNVEIQKLFHPALVKIDQEAAAAGNLEYWMQYDSNLDGTIDSVLAIHSGYGAEFSGNDCSNDRESFNRIQSRAFSGSEAGGWVSAAETLNYQLGGFAIIPGIEGVCGEEFVKVGKAAHELTHTLGTFPAPPDLYDSTTEGNGAGGFDIMSNSYGPTGLNGKAPGSMSPWTKQFLNWTTPTEILVDGDYSMRPSTDYPDYLVIKSGFPDKEYLLMEYRAPVSPWDADFFGNGMVLYHIDDAANLQTQPGFPEQGDFPQNGKHYQVAVVQADGLYNLEKGQGLGDVFDLYTPGMSIGPGPNTFPNTDSYQNGQVTQTGVTITVLSMGALGLTIRVEGIGGSAPSAPTTMAAPVTSPLAAQPPVAGTVPTISSPVQSPVAPLLPQASPIAVSAPSKAPARNSSSPQPPPPAGNATSSASSSLLDRRSQMNIQRMALLLTASVVHVWML